MRTVVWILSFVEILPSYGSLLDGTIDLNVPPQHDGGGPAQKCIPGSVAWEGGGSQQT
jgi:hypothetical protein